MSKKHKKDSTQIWSALSGRTLRLAGPESEQRQIYAQNLVHIASQKKIDLTVTENLGDTKKQDLVLLFAEIKMNQEEAYMKKILQDLQVLSEKKPEAILLISDCKVYGTLFGKEVPLKEEELGYISHTGKEQIALQYMRMAEHLACRLAREEQLHICAARQYLREETQNLEQMMESVIQVLLYGQSGEIYNLPSSGEPLHLNSEEADDKNKEHSPLSPMERALDVKKLTGITPEEK